MKKLVLGIDVGGTNIKLGLINPSGRVIFKTNLMTKSFIRDKNKLISALLSKIQTILGEQRLSKKNILGIGIGLPGAVHIEQGLVRYLTNIFNWKDVPLKRILERKIHIPVFLDNDANLFTLGEWKFGAGRSSKNMVCITLGTGVGGGLILNGVLFRGEGYAAGEIGHIPINEEGPRCHCGGYGCLECYVGNNYLLRKAKSSFKSKDISLEKISLLASQGNRRALQFWQQTALHLGNGLAGVVNLLNPDIIVIGGGVANAYSYMSKTIEKTIKLRAMKFPGKMMKIAKAKLGNDAGMIGAQVLVHNAIHAK